MKRIFIITCSENKLDYENQAKNLYTSQRFKLAKDIAEKYGDDWFIISAKHGLLKPTDIIQPYNASILEFSLQEKQKWAKKAFLQIIELSGKNIKLICLGDPEYFKQLAIEANKKKVNIYIPFKHISKDNRIKWLNQVKDQNQKFKTVHKLYKELSKMMDLNNQFNQFKTYSGKNNFPQRGVYIFFDTSDTRNFDNQNTPRIVRIGTHTVSNNSKSTLWQRLKAHKGKENGDGNHRSSIFRSHVGTAYLAKNKINCSSWGKGKKIDNEIRQKEVDTENFVSDYIGKMKILWIAINDYPSKYSDRAYIEQNLIAILSGKNNSIDIPSENWLGFHCQNQTVKDSFLWNVQHTSSGYDPNFLKVLSEYIERTLKNENSFSGSIAPKGWYENAKLDYKQISLKF
jgi:hypothetical protein